MARVTSIPILALLLILATSPAEASCGTRATGLEFGSQVQERLRCEKAARRSSGATCSVDVAQGCPQLMSTLVEQVFGNDPLDEDTTRLRCRDAIRRATQSFVRQRTKELVLLRRRRATRAAAFVESVTKGCTDAARLGPLPVGGVCSRLTPGTNPRDVAYCLRGVLEQIVQSATGISLRPNILFVLTDDQRWDTMDVMPLTTTAVFDRGIDFTESFTSTSLCCPNRASILTGLYAHNHGVTSNKGALLFDHDGDTIARRLQEKAGYRTALVGKYLVHTGKALGRKVPPGWDDWFVFLSKGSLYYGYALNVNGRISRVGKTEEHYSTDYLARHSEQVVAEWADRPWFVYYAPFAPHKPPVPARRHEGRFEKLAPWRPPSHNAKPEGKPKWVAVQHGLALRNEKEPEATDIRRRRQLESLLAVDEAVGALSDLLEDLGLTDNTVVVFTSDNGQPWLEHGLILKNYPYEESIRVPLAIRYPKLAHLPRKVSAFVQPIDFYPTFAALAGIEPPRLNGESLVPFLEGRRVPWRKDILIEHFEGAGIHPSRGVRNQRWKLIETDAPTGITLELYDLKADPYELHNLAGDSAHASTIEALQARVSALSAE